ncbi:hypothetical protein WR25_16309 [Diploscapter pachys]|uniref:Uncharacterized protein n=1 Tax=Diploscapter pachys TaxID=2018661 RepID=A0A2A2JCS6_9BILA|nr:hypothetical protein WR25_16309 [Diploscapter pachys]
MADSVTVWMKDRTNLVERMNGLTLRIRSAEHFGESVKGFPEGNGRLVQLTLPQVLALKPTAIELLNSRGAFKELAAFLEGKQKEEVSAFFCRTKLIALHSCDVSAKDLLVLLDKLDLLAAWSSEDSNFTKSEWESIVEKLAKLNVRAIGLSENILEAASSQLNPEMLVLACNSSLKAVDFQDRVFPTVRILVAQEIHFVDDADAERLLDVLGKSFPNLLMLCWDWNMVDPCIIYDERTKIVLDMLIKLHKQGIYRNLSIVGYSPDAETKGATDNIARHLNDAGLKEIVVTRFATKGYTGDPNFTLIVAGNDIDQKESVVELYANQRSPTPQMVELLSLLPASPIHLLPASTVDFGGFDSRKATKLYEEACKQGQSS